MEQKIKTKKIKAGRYIVTDGCKEVLINYHYHLHGWIASAGWDFYLYTDICQTKRDAKKEAEKMLKM